MTHDITIPPEAVEAAARAIRTFYSDQPVAVCDGASYKAAYAALRAGIAAWPGMRAARNGSSVSLNPHIILPLPQENTNEKV